MSIYLDSGKQANEYREEIDRLCREALSEYPVDEDGEGDSNEDARREWIEQTVDGHEFVIYTGQAMAVLMISGNDGAFFDDFGTDGAVGDGGIEWSKLAYCAMLADCWEALSELIEQAQEDARVAYEAKQEQPEAK